MEQVPPTLKTEVDDGSVLQRALAGVVMAKGCDSRVWRRAHKPSNNRDNPSSKLDRHKHPEYQEKKNGSRNGWCKRCMPKLESVGFKRATRATTQGGGDGRNATTTSEFLFALPNTT